jgi:hypothetical protein
MMMVMTIIRVTCILHLRFLILLCELMQVDNERFITMNNLFGDENRTLARSLCAKTKT